MKQMQGLVLSVHPSTVYFWCFPHKTVDHLLYLHDKMMKNQWRWLPVDKTFSYSADHLKQDENRPSVCTCSRQQELLITPSNCRVHVQRANMSDKYVSCGTKTWTQDLQKTHWDLLLLMVASPFHSFLDQHKRVSQYGPLRNALQSTFPFFPKLCLSLVRRTLGCEVCDWVSERIMLIEEDV